MKSYEFLEHTADLVIKAYGKSYKELFTHLLLGMYQALYGPISYEELKKQNPQIIRVGKTSDYETLLVNFLNEILYHLQVEKILFFSPEFQEISLAKGLVGKFQTSPLSQFKNPKIEIKAATYHDLKIKKVSDYLETKVVFDI